MNNKILVTGGCGYIGSHTVVTLIENNFEVIIADNLSNSTSKTLERIEKITGVKPTFLEIDLKEFSKVEELFNNHKDISAVIHFAAHKAVGESVQNPLMYYQNNLVSLINTLICQLNVGINNFIFSSSATVYANPDTLPITEQNKTKRPFSPYGNTKKVAEEILEDVVTSNENFNAISLRYFNPIGAHSSGLIGELPNGIPNNLMPYITQTAVGIREKLLIYGNDYPTKDGTPIRDYIHVVDLAEAHVKALKRLLNTTQGESFEVFNLGTGKGSSVMDVLQTFEKVTEQKLNYEIVERRNGDVPVLYAATALAEEELAWKANRELEEMIASSWKWEQNVRKENTMSTLFEKTHIRKNILTGEKVLVSPHRNKRPWQGKIEETEQISTISYDAECFLCPTNTRFGGEQTPKYADTFVFVNDFAALHPNVDSQTINKGLLEANSEKGICKVICFSPNHSLTLSKMSVQEIIIVIHTWQKEFKELSEKPFINTVQIFENRGEIMGCSNPHPHGQIWAQETIPVEIEKKTINFLKYFNQHKTSLLEDYIHQELEENERVLYENEDFVIVVPFWAVWPYETMIIPKKLTKNILEMDEKMIANYAKAIKIITSIYDKIFNVSFPYSAGIHQAPTNKEDNKGWHWHMSFYPPLLRSATVKKFMVGYEMFAMPQRDITPEMAASTLKKIADNS